MTDPVSNTRLIYESRPDSGDGTFMRRRKRRLIENNPADKDVQRLSHRNIQKLLDDALDFDNDLGPAIKAVTMLESYFSLHQQDRHHDPSMMYELKRMTLAPDRKNWRIPENRPYRFEGYTSLMEVAIGLLFRHQRRDRTLESAKNLVDFMDGRASKNLLLPARKMDFLNQHAERYVRDGDFRENARVFRDWPYDWVEKKDQPQLLAYMIDRQSSLLPPTLAITVELVRAYFPNPYKRDDKTPILVTDFSVRADPEIMAVPGAIRQQIIHSTETLKIKALRQSAVKVLQDIDGIMTSQFAEIAHVRAELSHKQKALRALWGCKPDS